MMAVLLALVGLASLDSLNVLNVGVVTAIVYDSRLGRRSPIPSALSFIVGVFSATTTFGLCTVLGLSLLTDLTDFQLTPTIRYRGALLLGLVLIGLACFPLDAQTSAPGWATAAMRRRPWLLVFVGFAVGLGQASTAVPYLTGLAMLAALDPRPQIWPGAVIGYCAIAVLPPALILALSMRRTKRAVRVQRGLVRGLTRYGPTAARILFVVGGVALVAAALIHHRALW